MSVLLTESIAYNVNGAKGILDNLRTFAVSVGWTLDYYQVSKDWEITNGWVAGSEDHVGLWSNGWALQNMVYRLSTVDRSVSGERVIVIGAQTPGSRTLNTGVSTQPWQQNYWNTYPYTQGASFPSSTFDALWLYGNKYFISMVAKVTSTSVIHMCFGSVELFKSWWYYTDGLYFTFPVFNYRYGTTNWSNMNEEDQKTHWYGPMGYASTSVPEVYFEGAPRSQSYTVRNYYATGTTNPGAEGGHFNKSQYLLNYNSYTDKRVAFNTTFFIRDPSTLIYYPLGRSPLAYLNGRNLTIGQSISFGTDTYRVFPNVYTDNEIWVGYLIS